MAISLFPLPVVLPPAETFTGLQWVIKFSTKFAILETTLIPETSVLQAEEQGVLAQPMIIEYSADFTVAVVHVVIFTASTAAG
jgi:hypothetical protein